MNLSTRYRDMNHLELDMNAHMEMLNAQIQLAHCWQQGGVVAVVSIVRISLICTIVRGYVGLPKVLSSPKQQSMRDGERGYTLSVDK